jgi:hypothetical protein
MVDALKLAGVAIAAIAVAGCASAPTPPTTAEKAARIKASGWQPGGPTFIPAEVLDLYPCHSAELPCGSLPPPAIEKVAFTGPVKGDPKKGEAIAINIRYGNCIACHTANGIAGFLPLTLGASYADLVNVPAVKPLLPGTRIIPGNSANSVLYIRVSGVGLQDQSLRMPQGGPFLDTLNPSAIPAIKAWIDEGAKNN